MRWILPILLVAACGSAPRAPDDLVAVVPGEGGDPVPCGADRLAGYIGQPVTALPGDEAPGSVRVIRPGDAVTEDWSETRLNVSLDGNDIIAALTCG
jgi:hypothetical protein